MRVGSQKWYDVGVLQVEQLLQHLLLSFVILSPVREDFEFFPHEIPNLRLSVVKQELGAGVEYPKAPI